MLIEHVQGTAILFKTHFKSLVKVLKHITYAKLLLVQYECDVFS